MDKATSGKIIRNAKARTFGKDKPAFFVVVNGESWGVRYDGTGCKIFFPNNGKYDQKVKHIPSIQLYRVRATQYNGEEEHGKNHLEDYINMNLSRC